MPQLRQSILRNRLLRAMAPEDFARLQPHLDPIALQLREVVIAPDAPVDDLLFLETGMVSISTAHDDRRIEVGLVGSEGLVGAVPVGLDCTTTPHVYFVQLSGEGLSIGREAFCAALDESPALRRLLLRYVHTLIVQITQTAYAHASLSLESRLARWLLMCHDRTEGDELVLTHDFLSMMLGVQRAGVTLAIQNLEGAGRIRAKRRRIEVLDRDKLMALTNGSYGTPEAEYARLIEGA
ncbi:cAMP-binding domain of CRP or a regulatory subunit of cAMP-dependent protein kinases [Methylobacterium sp. 174MFSha1.1]|uniref:Crp/Fnr family transcriptional regulator n=1 Tax=Methylobacterium sp. 174MFSha1.1 TaxID=1502749 RepID=UPI0008ED44B2|nr:Crp/Fnr family transcriptional regulator [Methylobacterium sp. 174MFSha1.1]SFU69967.1 cAMP-binding domain of CRP or a regulatory subunit of cAMP-dependent protein kinases [Methylobacterium sp. 174MFSha1.1]